MNADQRREDLSNLRLIAFIGASDLTAFFSSLPYFTTTFSAA